VRRSTMPLATCSTHPCVEGLAGVAAALGEWDRARRVVPATPLAPGWPPPCPRVTRAVMPAPSTRAALGEERDATMRAEGEELSIYASRAAEP
jgi:hypothetical protein